MSKLRRLGWFAFALFCVGVATSLLINTSAAHPSLEYTVAAHCASPAAAANIGGHPVCLREGQPCTPRLAHVYRRYRLECDGGTLETPWAVLARRPLHVPTIASGAACPAATPNPNGDLGVLTGSLSGATAWGNGPAFPVIPRVTPGPTTQAEVPFIFPPPPGLGQWAQQKVLWVTKPTFRGRVLIRGQQLDGPNDVRFDLWHGGFDPATFLHPAKQLKIQGGGGHPATTRVAEPGCYAWQLDTRTSSQILVFQAVPQGSK
ncbi:MAG TPA: hypothetical protein VFA19_04520 [Gaiellaceae bacterium]|nr:hypothetical protein [Gaiellaceae bacterium]